MTRDSIYNFKKKIHAYSLLGNVCECCGEDEIHFLSIDHFIPGDGISHRKQIGKSARALCLAVIREIEPRKRFRLLCGSCHLCISKKGYCIHDKLKFDDCFSLNYKSSIEKGIDMNNVFISGKLVSDPQVRPAGQYKVAGFSIAVTDAGKKQSTSFFDVEAWNKTAEMIGQYFVKGRTISLQGKLKQDSYTDQKTNQTVKKVKIVVDSILNLPQGENSFVENQNAPVEEPLRF